MKMEQNNSKKEFRLYDGTLKEYIEELWKNKRGDGTVVKLGDIHPAIICELAKINILLEDTRVIIDQRSATKYFTHPKSKKGALLPIDEYELLEKAVVNPFKLYEDATQGDLVYIYSYPYTSGKLVKLVVQPNYQKNGRTYNNAKSWGIIQEGNLNNPKQYRLIWEERQNGA